jgi:hypothetical protein
MQGLPSIAGGIGGAFIVWAMVIAGWCALSALFRK